MSFAAALLPVVVYIALVYVLDNFALVSVKRLLALVLCGMVSALISFGLFQLTGKVVPERVSDFLDPLVEELVKAVPLVYLASRKKVAFFIDSVICGAAVGGGFSILENVFYLVMGEPLSMGTALFRGLEVALIHMGCSAVVAAALMLAVRLIERERSRLEVKQKDVTVAAFLMASALVVHIFHNSFHFPPLIQYAFVFGSLAALLLWTYQYDAGMIHRWLDKGIDKQIALLTSIREGNLEHTRTGAFLLSVRDAFPPEVFFDIICFVQLHMELTLAARSWFMLHEAGLAFPLEPERAQELLSQYSEYVTLEKRLGRTARMAVAPVVKFYPSDRKALDDLLSECKR